MSSLEKLTTSEELEAWLERSSDEPVWIFKHSLVCSVSDAALDEFRRFVGSAKGRVARAALLEIQRARPISAEVQRRTGVRHESPQALLLVAGRAVWHASHWSITAPALEAAERRVPAAMADA